MADVEVIGSIRSYRTHSSCNGRVEIPGGILLHVQHGTTKRSQVNCYPMSQQTDMFTNFVQILYGLIMILIDAPIATALPWFLLSAMEVVVHTMAGCQMKNRFVNQGKKTLYNPGLVTSWFGFLPVFAAFIVSFFVSYTPTLLEAVIAIAITFVMTKTCINGVESAFKKVDNPYPYTWGRGYFNKFEDITEEN